MSNGKDYKIISITTGGSVTISDPMNIEVAGNLAEQLRGDTALLSLTLIRKTGEAWNASWELINQHPPAKEA